MDVSRVALRSVARLGAAAQNALEIARFGGLRTDEQPSPFEVVADVGIGHLRRYFPPGDAGDATGRPVALLVPPLMLTAEVWDVSPATSTVAALHDAGIDPYVIDFGSPEDVEGGLQRTLPDHVLTVDAMIDEVRERTGRDVHLLGYSQGGMFCYQAAAVRRSAGLRSIVTFGSPVDWHLGLPFGLPVDLVSPAADFLARTVIEHTSLPRWATRTAFKLLDPVKTVKQRAEFLRQLADRERLLAREAQRRFLDRDGFTAYPGPALADLLEQFVSNNRMRSGGIVLEDRLVTLADVDVPVLIFVGDVDEFARPPAVRAIAAAAPRAEVHERTLSAGHFALVVGSRATDVTWPTVTAWIHHREALADGAAADVDQPGPDDVLAQVHRLSADDLPEDEGPGLHLGYGLDLVANASVDLARALAGAVADTTRVARSVGDQALEQLPRLMRLQRTTEDTRLSLGSVLDEQAEEIPDAVFFLFQDRAHTFAAVKSRIDAVVRGLLSLGVRQGEHVGVLMGTRPSALAAVAALNRIGAVAVLLRPGGPLERELELGRATRVLTDPEHAAEVASRTQLPVAVLGGGAAPRELGADVVDLERVDPDQVVPPAWYRPNPGRAADVAYLLFTGHGEDTRVNRITNRRWSLSAYATASAAGLSTRDTVYGLSPVHHPSGLLTSLGGAVAGGARLALTPDFDPETFWEEVRRYGVTVVSYTWAMCRELLRAPVQPAEHQHPVRLFVGAGMPAGLWRAVQDRFAPARVLELYASTEAEAVLGNVSGGKLGAKGRPLPGSARIELAAYDLDAGELEVGDDGFLRRCGPDEVGMLLAEVPARRAAGDSRTVRGAFRRDDAWLVTGDLFRRDADGDLWLVDHAESLVRTEHGPVPALPVEDALGSIPAVELAVLYDLPRRGRRPLAVAAVTVRSRLRGNEVQRALGRLPVAQRPDVVRVVEEIALTTWYRPRRDELREQGLPDDDAGWWWDPDRSRYVSLDADARTALLRGRRRRASVTG